jgi:signal transduction histidine kinase
VAPAEIRAACARDLAILTGTGTSLRAGTGHRSQSGGAGGGPLDQVVETAVAHAAALGLELTAHLGSLERQDEQHVRLDPLVAAALGDALAECIANVGRHAGVGRLDLIASVTRGAVVLLVVDEGRGFDPAAVPEDRLGLRASVQERLSGLGGSVAVWSRPDRGTSVKIRVPLPAAKP